MNINKRPWPLATICGPIRERIDTRPDYQRPLVWSRAQKQLLIDTIVRGYDVPKLYWRRVGKNPDRYEVVDGQQRLHAVWDFFDGKYPLASDSDPINRHKVADLRYSELHDELRIQFDTYPLDIIILEDTEEEEAREMFLRLQGGTTLRKSEKRNALSGNMRNLVKELAQHEFFLHCGFASKRFDFDEVVAQTMLLELNQGPCEVGDPELTKAYHEYADFDFERGQGKKYADKIRRVYDFLLRAFPEKTPELKKSTALSLYWFVSILMTTHAIAGYEKSFGEWFIDFDTQRAEDEDKPQDERDPDLVAYQKYSIQATNHRESVEYRHRILASAFLLAFPDLPRLDNRRDFTEEQRLAIFRKYDGVCQWVDIDGRQCETRCTWSDWHADHIIPWSKGGPTTVANGQLLCPRHNLGKGNDHPGSNQTPNSIQVPERTVRVQSSGSKPVATNVGAKGYASILEHLRSLGWQPEQTLGDGRNCYRLSPNRNEVGIFYHSAKQRRGNYDFYFFALTCSLFERLRSKSNLYVFLECGTAATVLILPAEELREFLDGVPTAHGAVNWVINVLCDGNSWELKLSGKPRIDVTDYLNRYPALT